MMKKDASLKRIAIGLLYGFDFILILFMILMLTGVIRFN